jgi:hypothetical protein
MERCFLERRQTAGTEEYTLYLLVEMFNILGKGVRMTTDIFKGSYVMSVRYPTIHFSQTVGNRGCNHFCI